MEQIKIIKWQYEDELTEKEMYNALFPLSKVDIVRMFPVEIKIINEDFQKYLEVLNFYAYSPELYDNGRMAAKLLSKIP